MVPLNRSTGEDGTHRASRRTVCIRRVGLLPPVRRVEFHKRALAQMAAASRALRRTLRENVARSGRVIACYPIQNTVERNCGVKRAAHLTADDQVSSAAQTDGIHQNHI